jgi:hypothetical protein
MHAATPLRCLRAPYLFARALTVERTALAKGWMPKPWHAAPILDELRWPINSDTGPVLTLSVCG